MANRMAINAHTWWYNLSPLSTTRTQTNKYPAEFFFRALPKSLQMTAIRTMYANAYIGEWFAFFLCMGRLSGESPFQGDSDAETQALVTAARYEFDEESFEDISDEARDFISSLLQKDPRFEL